MNWHGLCSKFSDHYIERQSADKSIFKSSKLSMLKRLKEYQILVEKKKLQEFDNARQMLLLKKKKEKAKHLRLVALLENNKALDHRMDEAAIVIQRWTKGFLIRKQYKEEMWNITVKLLYGKVNLLENSVEKCLKYIGDAANIAATTIQKYAKRFLAIRLYKKLQKDEILRKEREKQQKALIIQRLVRGFLGRKRAFHIKQDKILSSALEKIRKKLLVCRLKEFWHRKKFVWETIRKKYKDPQVTFEIRAPTPELLHENPGTLSKILSASSSHVISHRNTIILKEPIPNPIEKPPKVPKPLTLQYLKPTEAFLSRIADDTPPPEDKNQKSTKIRNIRGRRYQRDTTSRVQYISTVQTEKTIKSRAASADYKRKKEGFKTFEKTMDKFEDGKNTQKALAVLFENEVPRFFNKQKPPVQQTLLSKLEDYPTPINEEVQEKVYVYNPPKFQSLSFRDALPDVNALLETYAKSIKRLS